MGECWPVTASSWSAKLNSSCCEWAPVGGVGSALAPPSSGQPLPNANQKHFGGAGVEEDGPDGGKPAGPQPGPRPPSRLQQLEDICPGEPWLNPWPAERLPGADAPPESSHDTIKLGIDS